MKKEEFLKQIEGYAFPEMFNQDLLDRAAEMFGKWGKRKFIIHKSPD